MTVADGQRPSSGYKSSKVRDIRTFRVWVVEKGYDWVDGRLHKVVDDRTVPVSPKMYGKLKRNYYHALRMIYLNAGLFIHFKLKEKDGMREGADKRFGSKWHSDIAGVLKKLGLHK